MSNCSTPNAAVAPGVNTNFVATRSFGSGRGGGPSDGSRGSALASVRAFAGRSISKPQRSSLRLIALRLARD
jgi:hypothetical protein